MFDKLPPTENWSSNMTLQERHQNCRLHSDCRPAKESVGVNVATQLVCMVYLVNVTNLPTNRNGYVIKYTTRKVLLCSDAKAKESFGEQGSHDCNSNNYKKNPVTSNSCTKSYSRLQSVLLPWWTNFVFANEKQKNSFLIKVSKLLTHLCRQLSWTKLTRESWGYSPCAKKLWTQLLSVRSPLRKLIRTDAHWLPGQVRYSPFLKSFVFVSLKNTTLKNIRISHYPYKYIITVCIRFALQSHIFQNCLVWRTME